MLVVGGRGFVDNDGSYGKEEFSGWWSCLFNSSRLGIGGGSGGMEATESFIISSSGGTISPGSKGARQGSSLGEREGLSSGEGEGPSSDEGKGSSSGGENGLAGLYSLRTGEHQLFEWCCGGTEYPAPSFSLPIGEVLLQE